MSLLDVLKSASLPTRDVSICVDARVAGILAETQANAGKILKANEGDDRPDPEYQRALKDVQRAKEALDQASVTFRLEATTEARFTLIQTECPPVTENDKKHGFGWDAFTHKLVRECIRFQDGESWRSLTDDEWAELLAHLDSGNWDVLVTVATDVNTSQSKRTQAFLDNLSGTLQA